MTMYFCILSAFKNTLAWYFEAFFWISHLSSLFLNDIQHTLTMKYTKVQNITEERTITTTVIQIMRRTLQNIIYWTKVTYV